MAGGGEEIGKAYITIEARGGESVAREVQKIEEKAKSRSASALLGAASATAGGMVGLSSEPVLIDRDREAINAAHELHQIKLQEIAEREALVALAKEEATAEANIADQAKKTTQAVGFKNSVKEFVAPLHSARQGVQALIGATLGWTAAIGAVSAAAGLLWSWFTRSTRQAEQLGKEIQTLQTDSLKLGKSLKDLNDIASGHEPSDYDLMLASYQKLADEKYEADFSIAKKTRDLHVSMGMDQRKANKEYDAEQIRLQKENADSINAYKEKIEIKRQSDQSAANAKEEQKKQDAYKAAADLATSLENEAELARLSGIDKISEVGKQKVAELEKERAKQTDDATREQFDRAIEAQKKLTAALVAEKRKEDDKKTQEEIKQEREKAQQIAQLYVDAANDSRAAIQAAFGGGTSGLLQEMISKLNVIATGIQRLN